MKYLLLLATVIILSCGPKPQPITGCQCDLELRWLILMHEGKLTPDQVRYLIKGQGDLHKMRQEK